MNIITWIKIHFQYHYKPVQLHWKREADRQVWLFTMEMIRRGMGERETRIGQEQIWAAYAKLEKESKDNVVPHGVKSGVEY